MMIALYAACIFVLCNSSFIEGMDGSLFNMGLYYSSPYSNQSSLVTWPQTNDHNQISCMPYVSGDVANNQPVVSCPMQSVVEYSNLTTLNSYQVVQSAVPAELMPSYKASYRKPIQARRELKPLLPKQLVVPSAVRMNKLYYAAHDIVWTYGLCDAALMPFIRLCNDSKSSSYGINEDSMGKFAFEQRGEFFPMDGCKVAVFFYCLKQYNKAVGTIHHEIVPAGSSLLGQILTSSNSKSNPLQLLINDLYLIKKIRHEGDPSVFSYLAKFVEYIHLKKQVPQDQLSNVPFDSLRTLFVKGLFYFVNDWGASSDIHPGVHSFFEQVDSMKKIGCIKKASDLGIYILNYEPTYLEKLGFIPTLVPYANKKQRMSIICACIEKSDNARGSKAIPDKNCYIYHKLINKLHLALPDSFDSKQLDSNYVAFEEFKQLSRYIKIVLRSSEEAIKSCVKEMYPSYKEAI